MRMVGSGVVVDQTPAAGTPLERGSFGVLTLLNHGAAETRPTGGGR
jgi:hypothetical protein